MPTDSTPTLDRLRYQDRAAYHLLYQTMFPAVLRLVRKNGGNQADAEDVFQETVLVLAQKVQQPDFRLTASLRTYLTSITRHLWLNRLRQRRRLPLYELPCHDQLPDNTPEEEFGLAQAILGWLDQATPFCKALLRAVFFDNEPMESLLVRLGWKNKHTAANQKYKCVQQLRRAALPTG
jgi:RNA polymerase sigma factor (sigma-70 family)